MNRSWIGGYCGEFMLSSSETSCETTGEATNASVGCFFLHFWRLDLDRWMSPHRFVVAGCTAAGALQDMCLLGVWYSVWREVDLEVLGDVHNLLRKTTIGKSHTFWLFGRRPGGTLWEITSLGPSSLQSMSDQSCASTTSKNFPKSQRKWKWW